MPLAIDLAAPKRVVVARIRRPNLAWIVGPALRRNAPILQLNLFTGGGTAGRMTVDIRWPCLPDYVRSRRGVRGDLAVGHMVGSRCRRSRSRRVNVSCVTVARHRVVVGALVREVEVSKWVQRAIQVVVVVAITTAVEGVVRVAWVDGGLRDEGTGVVYHGLVGIRCVPDSDTCIANAVAIAGSNDARGCGTVGGLARIAEDTALAVARSVDVLVTGFRVRLHYDGGCAKSVEAKEIWMSAVLYGKGSGLGTNCNIAVQ